MTEQELWSRIEAIGGWLSPSEAHALWRFTQEVPAPARCVEIGSWLGRSTCALAFGLRARGSGVLFAVDPHRGTTSHKREGIVDTYDQLVDNLERRGLLGIVQVLRQTSVEARRRFDPGQPLYGPLHLVWIDGCHDLPAVRLDTRLWVPLLAPNGLLVYHDRSWDGPAAVIAELRRDPRFEALPVVQEIAAFRRRGVD